MKSLFKHKKLKYIMLVLTCITILISTFGVYYWKDFFVIIDVFIDESLKIQLTNEIQEILQIRNNALLQKDSDTLSSLYYKEMNTGLWAFEHEERKMKNLHKWAQKQSVEFKEINSQAILKSGKEKSNGYSIYMLVNTEYQYVYVDDPQKINSFRLGSYHSLDLIHDEDGEDWLISKEWYADPFMISFNQLEDAALEEGMRIILGGTERHFSDLNERRINAVAYADEYSGAASLPEYGFKYNTKYRDYNPLGGDCANFASQILFEGGKFPKNRTWNYEKGAGSRTWLNAHTFNNYMLNSGRASLIAKGSYQEVLEASYKLLPGDYVAYEKKGEVVHISVVTGADSKGYPLVNSHNADRHRAPWDIGWNSKGVKFWLVRVNY